jgi:hypothetical protein
MPQSTNLLPLRWFCFPITSKDYFNYWLMRLISGSNLERPEWDRPLGLRSLNVRQLLPLATVQCPQTLFAYPTRYRRLDITTLTFCRTTSTQNISGDNLSQHHGSHPDNRIVAEPELIQILLFFIAAHISVPLDSSKFCVFSNRSMI